MKKFHVLFILACFFLSSFDLRSNVGMLAPELFGDGRAYDIQVSHIEIAVISSHWTDQQFYFLMVGVQRDGYYRGYIMKLWGEKINQYGPYVHSTRNLFWYIREDSPQWRGLVEFRGHDRKFCGAFDGHKMPNPCPLQ